MYTSGQDGPWRSGQRDEGRNYYYNNNVVSSETQALAIVTAVRLLMNLLPALNLLAGGAVRRCRGAGARTEFGVGAGRSRAHEVQAQDAAGRTVTVTVTNWRKADLVELQAAESGSANWKKVLGALKAGQRTSAKVPQGNNCRVDLHGKFADGQSADASNVDVCADKTVNLTN